MVHEESTLLIYRQGGLKDRLMPRSKCELTLGVCPFREGTVCVCPVRCCKGKTIPALTKAGKAMRPLSKRWRKMVLDNPPKEESQGVGY